MVGATIEDQQTGRKTDVHARIVINATGPFADSVCSEGLQYSPEVITLGAAYLLPLPLSRTTHDSRHLPGLPCRRLVAAAGV